LFALAVILGLLLVGYAVVAWSANKDAPRNFGTGAAPTVPATAPQASAPPPTAAPSPPVSLSRRA